MNIQQYWAKIRTIENQLKNAYPSGEVWITSVDNDRIGTKAGAVTCAGCQLAAQRIVEQTHKPSTLEEVTAHKERQAENLRRANLREQKRAPRTVLVVGQENANDLNVPHNQVEKVVRQKQAQTPVNNG